MARTRLTTSNVGLAVGSGPSWSAYTTIGTDFVSASTTVETRLRLAVVDVRLTGVSGVAFSAHTDEFIVQVYTSFGSYGIARIAKTFIDFSFAL